MPRLKMNPLLRRGDPVVKLIWGEMEANDMSVRDLCEKADIGKDTLYNRKKTPDDFTLGELKRICRAMSIPVEELRGAIRY